MVCLSLFTVDKVSTIDAIYLKTLLKMASTFLV